MELWEKTGSLEKIGLVTLLILGISLAYTSFSNTPEPVKVGITTETGAYNVTVEVADNDSERKKGLMYREKLPLDQGMLFIFPAEDRRSFWMKNTYIPLDIVFIDSEGTVLNVEQAQPQPNTPESQLKRYRSDGEAEYVLELNSTFSEKYSLDAGDQIRIYSPSE